MLAATTSSRVTAVTVFRRGALVTRVATVARGDDGYPSEVRLTGLPLLLDDESLQVELRPEGPGQVPMAGEVRVTLAVPEAQADLRPPTREELRAAELALALAQQAQADLELVGSCVSAMTPGARGRPEEGKAPMASPTEARLSLLALRRERLGRSRPALTEATERVRVASERLETLRERERRAGGNNDPRTFEARKAVVVGLRPVAEHPAERLQLVLRYFVPGARWAPSYVLRLDPSLRGGTLELRALVGQATGERWTDVALTLSTANPQQWTELPELRSQRIGRAQPPPPKTGWRPPPPGTELLYADYDRARPPVPPPLAAPARPRVNEVHTRTQAGVLRDEPELEMFREIADEASGALALPEPEPLPKKRARRVSAPPPPSRAAPAPAPGAMPQAMPMAPPAEVAPAATMARSSGLGGMIGGAIDGLFGGGGGSGYAELEVDDDLALDEALAEPSHVRADRALLEYGSLWLPPPDDPRRGQLQRAGRADRYGRLAGLPPEPVAAALSQEQTARTKARALEARQPPAGHRWAEGTEGFDYAYEAQAHVDLDGDGDLHGLPLRTSAVETTPRFIAVPRETQDVFRVVVVRNPLDAPLLPGPVDVYLGGRFALASTLDVTPPRGRVELGLGVEQALKIARNVTFEEEPAGLLKRQRDLGHRIRIEVRSHLPAPATVEIRERLPVTREGEDDVEVLERQVDPPWDEHEQEDPPLRGGRAWKVEVPAGGERTLSAAYTIRIPKDHEIVGGNRREG